MVQTVQESKLTFVRPAEVSQLWSGASERLEIHIPIHRTRYMYVCTDKDYTDIHTLHY